MRITHQQYLNGIYPIEERHSITKLELSNRRNKDDLKLERFYNLAKLDLKGMEWKELDLSDCYNLEKINISGSVFANLDFFKTLPNPLKLNKLVITQSEFPVQDLSVLSPFVNLTQLGLFRVPLSVSGWDSIKFLPNQNHFKMLNSLNLALKGSQTGDEKIDKALQVVRKYLEDKLIELTVQDFQYQIVQNK